MTQYLNCHALSILSIFHKKRKQLNPSQQIELVSGNEARDGPALSSNPRYKYTIEF